jgi:hypothetical protein
MGEVKTALKKIEINLMFKDNNFNLLMMGNAVTQKQTVEQVDSFFSILS